MRFSGENFSVATFYGRDPSPFGRCEPSKCFRGRSHSSPSRRSCVQCGPPAKPAVVSFPSTHANTSLSFGSNLCFCRVANPNTKCDTLSQPTYFSVPARLGWTTQPPSPDPDLCLPSTDEVTRFEILVVSTLLQATLPYQARFKTLASTQDC